jgi:hypothetical protein
MMLAIALAATFLLCLQNKPMFLLGMKELAIFSFPFSFAGIFLLQLVAIWVTYFLLRKRTIRHREFAFAGIAVLTLAAGELVLPASYFKDHIRHARREKALNQIEVVGHSIEPLRSDQGGTRFALNYTLRFPRTAHYLTYPAWLGQSHNGVYGNYFSKIHPEYLDETYTFDAAKPYSFTVVFDTKGKPVDFSRELANIDICDGKDYYMTCRIISFPLQDVPTAFAGAVQPIRSEPEVPADNLPDILERSIRLNGLALTPAVVKTGLPVPFSYVIANTGSQQIAIPGSHLENLIRVNYAWEPVSNSAKKTGAITVRIGNAFAAGTAQFYSIHKNSLAPGEQVTIQDHIAPYKPFAPGDYRLHVFLFSNYATDQARPEQDLVAAFSIAP